MDYAIIAAGEGSRLAQEGVKSPKPLVKVDGVSLIDRLIDVFLHNNATSINVIVNEEMKEVQDHIKKLRLPVPLNIHIKSTPSSMHSFFELTPYFKEENICLTTVDTIFRKEEFSGYIKTFLEEKNIDGLMAVTDFIDDEKPLYVNTDSNLFINGFLDSPTADSRYISGGVYCLKRSALNVLQRAISQGISRMRNYQRELVAEGLRLKAYPFSKILDVDHAEDIVKAEQFLNSQTID